MDLNTVVETIVPSLSWIPSVTTTHSLVSLPHSTRLTRLAQNSNSQMIHSNEINQAKQIAEACLPNSAEIEGN